MEWTSVVKGVVARWAEVLGPAPPTVYPGQFENTDGWAAWYELWVPQWQGLGSKGGASHVMVVGQVFSRDTHDMAAHLMRVDGARRVMDDAVLCLTATSAGQGVLRMGRGEVRDLTQAAYAERGPVLLQHVVSWRGTLWEVG